MATLPRIIVPLLLLSFPSAFQEASAVTKPMPYPILRTCSEGDHYFKLVPHPKVPGDPMIAKGFAFSVGPDEDVLLWETTGSFENRYYLSHDGEHLVSISAIPQSATDR